MTSNYETDVFFGTFEINNIYRYTNHPGKVSWYKISPWSTNKWTWQIWPACGGKVFDHRDGFVNKLGRYSQCWWSRSWFWDNNTDFLLQILLQLYLGSRLQFKIENWYFNTTLKRGDDVPVFNYYSTRAHSSNWRCHLPILWELQEPSISQGTFPLVN